MDVESLLDRSRPFLSWIVEWYNGLEPIWFEDISGDPGKVAILSVDLVKGFCNVGPLSSERVKSIVPPIVELLKASWEAGVRHIALIQDAHPENAVEFAQFGPHCIRGTEEAQTVDEIAALPFFEELTIIEKNSISSSINTGLEDWLDKRPEIATFIIVGDCTDLCTYQLAMHIRLRANARQLGGVRVILPANMVETYDLPVDVAGEIGAVPHDADLLHLIFLYSMMLNGITVVSNVQLDPK